MSSIQRCRKRVAVIGAGGAGLAALKVLSSIDCVSVQAFETSSQVGGIWNYETNSKSGPAANPMYKSLRTNLPKEIMSFHPDSPFASTTTPTATAGSGCSGGGGGGGGSFVGHAEVQGYLEGYAASHGLNQFIRFGTEVLNITKSKTSSSSSSSGRITGRSEHGSEWVVETRKGLELDTGAFDYVIVCNGHYNAVHFPSGEELEAKGMRAFTGHTMHSADYDGPDPTIFGGKTVLIIGGRNSATDLAREVASISKKVISSDRNMKSSSSSDGSGGEGETGGRDEYHNLEHYPGVKHYNKVTNEVGFEDGSTVAGVDVIIFCTGFRYHFPFLSPGVSCVSGSGRRVNNLYEQLFNVDDPTLSFIGLPFSVVPFPLFYMQALAVASFITGGLQLPDLDGRRSWLQQWESALAGSSCLNDSNYHHAGAHQWSYMRRLVTSVYPDPYMQRCTSVGIGGEDGDGVGGQEDGEGEVQAKNIDKSHIQEGYGQYSKAPFIPDHMRCKGQGRGAEESSRLLRHLDACEAVYNENRRRKPARVGYSDDYRAVHYELMADGAWRIL